MPSLWDSFSGNAASKAIKAGRAEADGYINTGVNQATGNYNTGYASASSRIQPFSGSGASTLYRDYLGINGRPAQTNAMSNYQSSPYMSYLQGQGQRAVDRRANAGGGYYSGNALSEASRVNQGIAAQDYDATMGRLAGLAGQESQMGQFGANLDMTNAGNLANLNYGSNQQKAGNAINTSNALAQASGALWNNMTGLASMGISALNAFNPLGGKTAAAGKPSNNFAMSDNNTGWATYAQRY